MVSVSLPSFRTWCWHLLLSDLVWLWKKCPIQSPKLILRRPVRRKTMCYQLGAKLMFLCSLRWEIRGEGARESPWDFGTLHAARFWGAWPVQGAKTFALGITKEESTNRSLSGECGWLRPITQHSMKCGWPASGWACCGLATAQVLEVCIA